MPGLPPPNGWTPDHRLFSSRRTVPRLIRRYFWFICAMFLFSVVATSANVQFSSIASGAGYSCAVSAGFGVRCWGYGGFGTLGYGDMTSLQSIPSVELLKDAGSLAAGADFACSLAGIPAVEAYVPLNASLSLFCWGSNVHGQLGTGTDVANCVPVNVACAPSPVFVADGIPLHSRVVSGPASQHACLLSADGGELRCWGSGVRGQLGRGDTADFRSIPTDYVLSGVVSVATGWGHTCVIMKTTNGVRCWGHNGYGELGNGDVSGSVLVAPPAADVLVNVSTVSCGAHFTCVRMQASSGVRCWGGGYHGQLGNGRLDNLYAPPDADVITGVAFLAAGTDHVCVILQATSGVRCWGGNDYGELGNGRSDGLWSPVPPIADVLVGVRFLAAGSGVTCVIMSASNGVRCWGSNDHGALGNGGNSDAFCKLGVPCYTVPPPNDNPVLDHAGSVHGATAVGSHTRTAAIVAAVGGTCIVLLGIIWYRRCRGGERDVAPCPSVAANVSGGGHSHGSTGCVAHKAEFNGVAPQASHDIVESVALDRAARPAVSALRLPSHQPGEHEHKGSEYDFAMRRRAADGGSSPHHPADDIVVTAKGFAQDEEVYVYVRWSIARPACCKGFVLLALVDGGPQVMERVPCQATVTTYEKSLGPFDALDRTITLLLEAVPFEHQDGSHITQGSVRVESAFGRWLRTCGFGDDVYAAVVPWLKRSGVGVGGDLDTVLSFVWAEGRDDWNLSPDARLKLEFALAEYFRSNEGVAQSSPQ